MITLIIMFIVGILKFVLSLVGLIIRIALCVSPLLLIGGLFVPSGLFLFRPMPFMFFRRHHRCGRRFY